MGINCDCNKTVHFFEHREQAATTAPARHQELTTFLTSNVLHMPLTCLHNSMRHNYPTSQIRKWRFRRFGDLLKL